MSSRWSALALVAALTAAAPAAALAADPPPVVLDGPSGPTSSPSPTFTFSSADPSAVFACELDGPGGPVVVQPACPSPQAFGGLADGAYRFSVQATGAEGAAQASRSFTVDTTPPAPPALSGTPAAFEFSSAEPNATFECALDGPSGPGAFHGCASPQPFPGLPPGAYTLRVRAIDAAGNAGAPAALGFTVPAPAPAPSPAAPPPAPTPAAPSPVFHVSVVARPGLADVRVRLPGGSGYAPLTADEALPLGSTLDTRRGTVQIVSVSRPGGKPQRASFAGSVFRVTQQGGLTVLTLVGPCRPASRLHGDGRGAFAVRGRYSRTTVRAARWVVQDSCAGTLTRVLEGVVRVRDQARRRTVLVRAGRRYLARPRG